MLNPRNTMRPTPPLPWQLLLTLIPSLLLAPLSAQASCYKPSMSSYSEPSLPSRPFKPYCAAIKTCLPWEVDKYQREIENYVEELKRYVQQAHKAAHAYAEDAVKYAKCELNEE